MQQLPIKDHKGKTYRRFEDMCIAWHLNPSLVLSRLRKGWDVHRALTTRVDERITYVKKPNIPDGVMFGVFLPQYFKHLSDKLPRREYVDAINKDLKKIARTCLSQLRKATDEKELSYGLWLRMGSYNESVTCLLNLYLKVGQFPEVKVFNHSETIVSGEPPRLFCTEEFLKMFDGSEAMIEILEEIEKSGIHLRYQTDNFFLGFRNWGRLTFGSRYITLAPKKI